MTCPLLSIGSLAASEGQETMDCEKRHCAWWSGNACIVVVLGREAAGLAQLLARCLPEGLGAPRTGEAQAAAAEAPDARGRRPPV